MDAPIYRSTRVKTCRRLCNCLMGINPSSLFFILKEVLAIVQNYELQATIGGQALFQLYFQLN